MDKVIKWLAAVAGAVAGWFGGLNMLLKVLAIMMTLDYVTGIIVAACGRSTKTAEGGLSSKVGFIGLAKKGIIILIVLLATLLDKAIGNATMVFQMAASCYYIANEGLSVMENASLMGVPMPAFLKKVLETMKENAEKKAVPEVKEDEIEKL